jgi:hypothetical protein
VERVSFFRLSRSTSNSGFSQTPGLRTLLSVQDVDCESDDDETNEFTILRRQAAREWAGDRTHGEEDNDTQAISWPAPARNDNGRANLSAWSRPQSPTISQTRAHIPLIGLPSVRHAHSQLQASQVTRHRAQRPITLTLAQIPPLVLPRVVQLSPRHSQTSQVTQPPRRPPPAPVSNRFAAAQAIQDSTQEQDMPLQPLQSIGTVQWARSQVWTRRPILPRT